MEIKLPEIISIGIYNTNIAVKNKTVTNNRRTSMFEIEIPIENGGISYMDSEQMRLRPNMVICAKPGQVRHTKLPFKCYYIHFILTESELCTKLNELPNYLKTDKYEKYLDLFQKMYKYYNTAISTDEIILQSLVLELLYSLIKDSKKQQLKNQTYQPKNYTIWDMRRWNKPHGQKPQHHLKPLSWNILIPNGQPKQN